MIKDVIIKCPCCNKMNKVQFSFSKGTDNVKIIGELIHPIAMDEGLKLAIREGGRTIASGQVTKIIE